MRARAARRAGLTAQGAYEARRVEWLALGATRLEAADLALCEAIVPAAAALDAHRARRRDGVDLARVGKDAAAAAYWKRNVYGPSS